MVILASWMEYFWSSHHHTSDKCAVFSLLELWLWPFPKEMGGQERGKVKGRWEGRWAREGTGRGGGSFPLLITHHKQWNFSGEEPARCISKRSMAGSACHSRQIFMKDDSLQISQSWTSLLRWHRGAQPNWMHQQPAFIPSGPARAPRTAWSSGEKGSREPRSARYLSPSARSSPRGSNAYAKEDPHEEARKAVLAELAHDWISAMPTRKRGNYRNTDGCSWQLTGT